MMADNHATSDQVGRMSSSQPIRPVVAVLVYVVACIVTGVMVVLLRLPDSMLLVLIVPVILAPLFSYGRVVYLLMFFVSVLVAVCVTYLVSLDFRESIKTISATALTLVLVTEIIHSQSAARRRSESALQRTQALLNAAIDQSASGILVADAPDVRIRIVNAAALEIRGVAEASLTGIPVELHASNWRTFYPDGSIYHPEDLPLSRAVLHGEEVRNTEVIIRRQDGEDRWVLANAAPVRDTEQNVVGGIVVFSDITERKRAERELRESERFLQEIFDAIQDGISVLTPELEVVRVNRWMEHMYAAQMPLVGKKCYQVYQQRDDPCPGCPSAMVLSTGEPHTEPVPYTTPDGHQGWLELSAFPLKDVDGGVVGIIEYVKNISDRKRAEEERSRLAAAIEQSAESVMITDTAGTILYVNPAFERTSGYGLDQVIGESPRILQSGQHDQAFYRTLWETISSGRVWHGHLINRRRDGVLYTEEATISGVRDQAGEIVNYVAVKRDVTGELDLQERYRQSQKMEAVGRLAGGVAHDINNVLTAIQGYADLVLTSLDAEFERERLPVQDMCADLMQVLEAADRAGSLIRQLLAFSRRQVLQPRVLDLNDLLTDMEKLLRPLIGEHIEIDVVCDPLLGNIRADPSQIEQVILNLAVNARDAMPQGGKLLFETSHAVLDEHYVRTHPDARPGAHAVLAVSDTGVGMTDEVKDHLFEPFFTTKAEGKGSGLGLATVYGVVEQSGGHIEVETHLGAGSTFSVYLPLVDEPAVDSPIEGISEGPTTGTETILLAEDEASVRGLVERVLTRYGYTVLAARSPDEALLIGTERAGQIDLLVTDLVMPGMSGGKLAEHVSALNPDVKTLYISGYTDDWVVQDEMLDAGAHFMQKPFSPRALAQKVRSILDGKTGPSMEASACD